MRKLLLTLTLIFVSFVAKGQISIYSADDVYYDYVGSVEEMTPDEIRMYNQLLTMVKNGNEGAIFYVNAMLAQWNLEDAPATIIDLQGSDNITEEDSLPQYLGAKKIFVIIENTTPKTIKEITLYFKFAIDGKQAYNIKDGSEYFIVKFKDIPGRSDADNYAKIQYALLKTLKLVDSRKGEIIKPFYNTRANEYSLDKVYIKYEDGTTSSKASIFDGGVLHKSLMEYGPLKPYNKAINAFSD